MKVARLVAFYAMATLFSLVYSATAYCSPMQKASKGTTQLTATLKATATKKNIPSQFRNLRVIIPFDEYSKDASGIHKKVSLGPPTSP